MYKPLLIQRAFRANLVTQIAIAIVAAPASSLVLTVSKGWRVLVRTTSVAAPAIRPTANTWASSNSLAT